MNDKPGIRKRRFIDTYVIKIKPASEESRPSKQLKKKVAETYVVSTHNQPPGHTWSPMELRPLAVLLEVARAVEEDPVAVSLIIDSVNLCAKYIQAVLAHEGARMIDVYAIEQEEYRKHISELDKSRHAAHNALIAKVAAINRLCNSKGLDPIYTGDIYDRAEVGDFALEIVNDIFKLRVK